MLHQPKSLQIKDTAATQNPAPPCTSSQATSTPDPKTAAYDFATQISPPHASSIQPIPPPIITLQIPTPQASTSQPPILTPAQYISPPPSPAIHLHPSAGPLTTSQPGQPYPAQAQASTDEIVTSPHPPQDADTIEFLLSSSAPLRESAPRRYPLPPRPTKFKGCDQCWEVVHEDTIPVVYFAPVEGEGGGDGDGEVVEGIFGCG